MITIFLFNEFKYEEQLKECLKNFPFEFRIDIEEPCKIRGKTPDELFETNVKVFFSVNEYDRKDLMKNILEKHFTTDFFDNPVKPNENENKPSQKSNLKPIIIPEDRLVFHFLTNEHKKKENEKLLKDNRIL